VNSCGLAALGLLSVSAFGQTEGKETEAKKSASQSSKEFQERMEKQKAFSERMRNAGSPEERQQVMNEQMVWQRQMAIDSLKDQLRVSDQEWAVVKPRLQAVYDLVHPAAQMMGRNEPPKTELEQRSRELRDLLRDEKPDAEQIKAKLAAYRSAKEKTTRELAGARQSLRQIMSLRQEAVLALNGLLD
jgi:Spy/CpxP family protein refolding chaperone